MPPEEALTLDRAAALAATARQASPLDRWLGRYGFECAFDPAEAKALIRFAINNGIDPDGARTVPLDAAIIAYEATKDPAVRLAKRQEILKHYAALSRLTAPLGVTGRSIVHSVNAGRELTTPVRLAIAAFVIGVAVEVAVALAYLQAESPLVRYVGPLCWGGLGASVFLIKTISDKASDLTFDLQRLRGISARILLGAVFGALLVNAFDMKLGNVTTAGVAFIAGLGVKAIYAAFEALVNGVADRISGRPAAETHASQAPTPPRAGSGQT
jgi:hypothetical protein